MFQAGNQACFVCSQTEVEKIPGYGQKKNLDMSIRKFDKRRCNLLFQRCHNQKINGFIKVPPD